VVEGGLPVLVSTTSNYFMAPRGTPEVAVATLANAAKKVMADTSFEQRLEKLGVRIDPNLTGPRVGTYLRDEIAKWRGVIKRAAVKIA
jgi:tripartite-type tricarboxylate transporter receptor subunit TctC